MGTAIFSEAQKKRLIVTWQLNGIFQHFRIKVQRLMYIILIINIPATKFTQ